MKMFLDILSLRFLWRPDNETQENNLLLWDLSPRPPDMVEQFSIRSDVNFDSNESVLSFRSEQPEPTILETNTIELSDPSVPFGGPGCDLDVSPRLPDMVEQYPIPSDVNLDTNESVLSSHSEQPVPGPTIQETNTIEPSNPSVPFGGQSEKDKPWIPKESPKWRRRVDESRFETRSETSGEKLRQRSEDFKSLKKGLKVANAVLTAGRIGVDIGKTIVDCKGRSVARKADGILAADEKNIGALKDGIRNTSERLARREATAMEEADAMQQEVDHLRERLKPRSQSEQSKQRPQSADNTQLILVSLVFVSLAAYYGTSYYDAYGSIVAAPHSGSRSQSSGVRNNEPQHRQPPKDEGEGSKENREPSDPSDPCKDPNWPEGGSEPIKLPNGLQLPTEKRFVLRPGKAAKGSAPNKKMRAEMRARGGRPSDDAGHMQAKQHGGSGNDPLNLTPTDRKLNRGAFTQCEKEAREWLNFLQQIFPGRMVEVRNSVRPFYRDGNGRPDYFSYTMNLCVDGHNTNLFNCMFDQHADGLPSLMDVLFGDP